MWQYIVGMLLVPALLIGWLVVQQVARRFAKTHPEFGPYREEGGGCGNSCGCKGSSCQRKDNH